MKGLKALFLKLFDRKNKDVDLISEIDEKRGREHFDFSDSIQRESYVRSCLEQLSEASRELEEFSKEYEDVNLYLTDIEKIEEMEPTLYEELKKYAGSMISMKQSHEEIKNRKSLLSEEEYEHMTRIEEHMPQALKKLKEAEEYQILVKRDLARLDNEKQAFKYRKQELINGQRNMKGMTAICLGSMGFLVILLSYLNMGFGFDVSMGIVIAILIAAASLTLLFVKYNEASKELVRIDKSSNKLTLLNNTVKIRYVNNTNLLDFLYMKYGVQSAKSLKKLWDKYVEENNYRIKEEETKNEYEFAKTGFLRILRRAGLDEPNIWLHQLEAVMDEKELSNLRHGLIVQRTKLRKQMEYNAKLCEDAQQEVNEIATQYPSNAEHILEMLNDYQKAI